LHLFTAQSVSGWGKRTTANLPPENGKTTGPTILLGPTTKHPGNSDTTIHRKFERLHFMLDRMKI